MFTFQDDVEKTIEVLRAGGIILYPTDTVWGLGCDATNEKAVENIFRLKKRAENKSLIVLLADQRDLLQYVAALDLQVFDFLDQAKKPTTVIYQGAIGLAENVISPDGSAGIRVVQDPFCRHLLKRFRKPLVSTSANISGEPTPGRFQDISPQVKAGVDYVVQYRQDDHNIASPSAVVKWNEDGSVTIIRE